MVQFVQSLKDYLVSLGHGPFAVSNLPDSPRDIIAIYDTGGSPTELDDNLPGSPEEIAIQFRARNKSQAAARGALLAIQADLHKLTGVNLGDWTIYVSVATDRPVVLTREIKEGWSLVSNYEVTARAN
jgi:hypothetical protein